MLLFLCPRAERCPGGGHEHRRLARRPDDPQNGAAENEERVRAERRRPEADAQRARLSRSGDRSIGQVGHHRRGAAPALGRQAPGSGNHPGSRQ